MAVKTVTATRMTMLGLKDQTKVATRGHKLLKDKQDGLMQEFLQIIKRAQALRTEVEQALSDANTAFLEAQAVMSRPAVHNALAVSNQEISLTVGTKNVMSVKIPEFKIETKGNPLSYGFLQTRGELDTAILRFSEVFALMIQLAEIEKSAENLALEIEKTRRRVNALEHRLIPDLQETLRFVKMKLGEAERSAIVQIMAIKNLIEKNEKNK